MKAVHLAESGFPGAALAPRLEPARELRRARARTQCYPRGGARGHHPIGDEPCASAEHPSLDTRGGKARRSLSVESYLAHSHAMVSPSGTGPGPVDQLLSERGLKRRVALRVPQFYAALAIISKSDLLLTAPSALAQLKPDAVAMLSLPASLSVPEHRIQLIWHERFTSDPGQRWLRAMLVEVGQVIGEKLCCSATR
jgi:DNA-binding transcriptional LysR family regulator